MNIKLVVFDIDGVITNGKVVVDKEGGENKQLDFRDIDALFELKRRGYKVAFITGEKTPITQYFKNRFVPDYFYEGCKQKDEALREIVQLSAIDFTYICYVGDGKYDIPPLQLVHYPVCPANAIEEVKQVCKYHLTQTGGDGCVKELLELITKSDVELQVDVLLESHFDLVKKVLSSKEIKTKVESIVDRIIACYQKDGQVLICGNGGSAADAQHIAGEFVGRFCLERPALSAEALTANSSITTAIGNDYSFDRIFSRQVEGKGRAGDILIGMTTSGKSKNIINAFIAGRNKGMFNVALVGEKSNAQLDEYADIVVTIPSVQTPRIQEMHMLIGHIICQVVEERMFLTAE